MRIAVSNLGWEPVLDQQVSERLLAAGVVGVEIAPTKVWADLSSVAPSAARAYGERWRGVGLPVVAAQSLLFGRPDLHLFDDTRHELVKYLSTVMDVCVAMGARILVFGSPRNRLRGSLELNAADQVAIEIFAELAEHAAALGACLCIEANPTQYGADYITSAHEAAALVGAVDSPGLRLHLDVACMALAGDDAAVCVSEYIDILRHVHLSAPDLGPVGDPDPQHTAMADALRSAGYSGFVSVEMRPAQDDIVAGIERAARYAVDTFGDVRV